MYLNHKNEFESFICNISKKYKFITVLIEYASFSKLYDFDKLMVVCFTNQAINLENMIPDEDCIFLICNFKNNLSTNNSESIILKDNSRIMHFELFDISNCFTSIIMQCAELNVDVTSVYRADLDLMLGKICK